MRLRQQSGFLFLAGGAALLASTTGAWQNKDFKDWTEKDARMVVTDSPWAKEVPMPANGRPDVMVIEPGSNGAPPPSATMGNSASTANPALSNPGYPGGTPNDSTGSHVPAATAHTPSGMATSTGAPEHQEPVRILWASAVPVRLAVLKLRSGDGAPDETRVAKIHVATPNYVLVVRGLPAPDADTDPKALAKSAFLTLRNKPAVAAQESGFWAAAQVYFFRFSKASVPIAPSDQEVEFRMMLGKIELKKKFELKEMRYQGQLAL